MTRFEMPPSSVKAVWLSACPRHASHTAKAAIACTGSVPDASSPASEGIPPILPTAS